ncbi:MAG: GT2 family glycosyltransferase, partial [Pseudohongiellaceae bacterium]
FEAAGGGEVGAVGPVLMYRDRPDVVWARGGTVSPGLNVTQLVGHGEAHVAATAKTSDVDYLPGTCLLISRKAWGVVGGLDERFFCYLEDADWGVRFHEAGLATVVVPAAVAYHGLSSSTGGGYSAGRKYMTGVNSVHFLRKHGDWRGWAGLLLFDLMLWPLAWARALLSGRASAAWAKLRGVFDGLRGVQVDASVAARYARRIP